MRCLLCLCLALVPLGAAENLGPRLEALLESPALAGASVGFEVARLSDGKVLYQHNSAHSFVPASNMKLFTTALALMRLGPDFRFTTEVVAGQPIDPAGSLAGDLVLVGGGDPSLSGRAYPYQYQPGSPPNYSFRAIDQLVDQLIARGLKRVDGDVVGDDRRYVWEPRPGGWSMDDTEWEYGAPVSALILNDNSFGLGLRPGARPGDLAQVWLMPPFEYFSIDNRVHTVAGAERKVEIERGPAGRQIHLRGTLPLREGGFSELLAVDDPALYAAEVLRDALERRGVMVRGEAVARHRFADEAPDEAAAPEPRVVLDSRTSPPLSELLQVTDKVSQNLHAEVMLREVGLAKKQRGSREAGLEEMQQFLREIGLGKDCCHFADGSGLSRSTLVTPAALVRLLSYMYKSSQRDVWMSLLPIAGSDGTLGQRFEDHPEARAIHAKTGSLSHVRALSGYAVAPGLDPLAFSLLVNNATAPSPEVRRAIDHLALALIEQQ
jgi:D-alanyl-D-alanine carboxypeptidase/D-alanyl-D-alanine-endopeptidase (penicillin-binding protein 4)